MWGVGASVSPYIMSIALVGFESWNYGYLIVSVIQAVLSVIIFISIPLWKNGRADNVETVDASSSSILFREIFAIKGAIPCFFMFFCYCSMELTTSLWASTYFVEKWGLMPEVAAGYASMFYIGVTFGRFINGFLAMKLGDHFLIRMGIAIIAVGIILLFIPLHSTFALVGFVMIGLGCAPVYPCIIHMTPDVFGADKSQAMIGIQMAFAYTGFMAMPPLFGFIADYAGIALLPGYLMVFILLMLVMHEVTFRSKASRC